MKNKIKNIQTMMHFNKLGGLVLFDPYDIFYSAGFRADNGMLFITLKDAVLAVPEMDYCAAKHDAACKVEKLLSARGFLEKYKNIKKICAGTGISHEKYSLLRSVFRGGVILSDETMNAVRSVKTADEIKKIRAACLIAKKAMAFAVRAARSGITEKELAAGIACFMLKNGADKEAFETIVAFGGNTSRPHHAPTGRELKGNDIAYIDLGCSCEGYCSDLTRTFFLGKITKCRLEVSGIVKEAQRRAIEAVRAGVRCRDIDSAARSFIAEKGFGKYFIHSTGHGVGVTIHEWPGVSPKSTAVLKKNMVITVEPGIYLPGEFGVRTEDTVLVTEKGYEVLTK